MKKFAKSLLPLAVLVLFGACLLSCISLLVVFLTSVGFADQVPLSSYEKLNIGVISVVAPAVGMMFFWLILLGLREKRVEDVKPAIIECDVILPGSEEGKNDCQKLLDRNTPTAEAAGCVLHLSTIQNQGSS